MLNHSSKNFMKGALVLAVCGVICKVLGAIYRIPLSNTIGTEGMGIYQMVYPVYSMLLMVSSAGIPIAISKIVSEYLAIGKAEYAKQAFHTSMKLLVLLGAASSLLLFLFSDIIASGLGLKNAGFSFRMISPSLFFVAVVCAYRGYLQGMQLMGATGVSQVIEQFVRLTIGLSIAKAWMHAGVSYGSGGALLGVTLSELLGLIVIMGYYNRKKRSLSIPPCKPKKVPGLLKKIIRIAFPVTIGACTMGLISSIDSAVIMRVLTKSGYTAAEASSLFGLHSGFVSPIINMPAVFSAAFAMSIVPAISAAYAKRNFVHASHQSTLGFKFSILLGIPSAIGLCVLAEPLLALIYPNLTGEELLIAAKLMRILSPGVLLITITQICTGILQGTGKTVLPVISMLLGGMVKLFLGVWLISIPSLNIYGAAIGTLICFAITTSIDIAFSIRYAYLALSIKEHLLKPLLSSAFMGVIVYLASFLLPSKLGTLFAILAGFLSYAILLVVTHTLQYDEIAGIPGLNRVAQMFVKLGIWRKP